MKDSGLVRIKLVICPILKTNHKNIENIICDNISLLLFILSPLVIIISALAFPIYGTFFNFDKLGSLYLVYNIIQSFLLGLSIDLLTLMQALRMSKKATKDLFIGLVVKIALQYPLVYFFQATGAIIATAVAFTIVSILAIRDIRILYRFGFSNIRLILVINVVFLIIISSISIFLNYINLFDLINKKITAIFVITMLGSIFLTIYLWLTNRCNLTIKLFKKKIGYKYFRYKHFK